MQTRSWTYRFGLAIFVLAALGVVTGVTAPRATASPLCDPPDSWGRSRADLAARVVALINAVRSESGLQRLAVSPALASSSRWKSLHMAAHGYFAHEDTAPPVSRSAHERALDCGYVGRSWGENIGFGYASPQSVVAGWLASPGHRANIENPGFTSTGVGVAASGSGRLYWTQSFGDDVPAAHSGLEVELANAHFGQVGESRFVASMSFVDRITGQPLARGSIGCRARVNGNLLRVVTNAFRGTSTVCGWRLPAWAHGRELAGGVTITVGDARVRHRFVRTVR